MAVDKLLLRLGYVQFAPLGSQLLLGIHDRHRPYDYSKRFFRSECC
jgi:hypothetical protein